VLVFVPSLHRHALQPSAHVHTAACNAATRTFSCCGDGYVNLASGEEWRWPREQRRAVAGSPRRGAEVLLRRC
jgi:hypothetical protein